MQPLDKQWLTAFAYTHYISNGEGNGTPLQYSCLETPMDRGAWWAAVHKSVKSWIRLSNFTFTFQFHALEKEMATHSSVLAWRIPGMGEPGGLPSVGLHRVGHDWRDLAVAAAHFWFHFPSYPAYMFEFIMITISLIYTDKTYSSFHPVQPVL